MSDQNNKELFRKLYNDHPEYIALRKKEGKTYNKYINDVKFWKLKYIEKLLQETKRRDEIKVAAEIGCATGILLSLFLEDQPLKRTGIDISDKNINAAKEMFPEMTFFCGLFNDYLASGAKTENIDVIILSDVLEHVEDDMELLNTAGKNSKYVIVNLPIEKVPEYKDRNYGVDDIEGHLRAYSVEDAIGMCEKANMEILKYYSERYVQQAVFRKYLLDKLLETNQDKTQALINFHEESLQIDMHSDYYKMNFFALLKIKQ